MKSYYSIMLFIMFAGAMAIMAVVSTITNKQDLSPADAAIVSLTVLAIMLAYRLSQAEKRIAHLEDKVENKSADKAAANNTRDAAKVLEEDEKSDEKEATKL